MYRGNLSYSVQKLDHLSKHLVPKLVPLKLKLRVCEIA